MQIPSTEEALTYLKEAQSLNPGPWVNHVKYVAQAARAIAINHPYLDDESAYILGLLHDIGRREGPTSMRHVVDGYRFLEKEGFPDAARICLTHSFPVKNVMAGSSEWDCAEEEIHLVKSFLERITYNDYDHLIQLCDSLALTTGLTLIEKRLLDVVLRHGFNEFTIPKWKAIFAIKQQFEETLGQPIYRFLPGVVENTFGYNPCQ